MARAQASSSRRIRRVLVCLRRGKPGAVGVAMVLKSIFAQAGVQARWVSESGLAGAKRDRIDAVVGVMARLLRQDDVRAKLLAAKTAEEFMSILAEDPEAV